MNILHMSDIHFCQSCDVVEKGYKGMIAKMENPLIHVAACLTHVRERMALDLVIISGDLTEDGSVEDYRYLKKWFKEQIGEIPILVTLGNHDIKAHFRKGWLSEEGSEAPYNQVMTLNGIELISFDSSVYGMADGQMSQSQFDWLEKQLKVVGNKPVLLITHHHLLEYQGSTPRLPESVQLLKLIQDYPVLALLNGHTHHAYTGDLLGIQYYTAGGMSFVGEDEGVGQVRFEERYGYNVYCLKEGKINQQTTENFITGRVIARVNMLEE